MWKLNVPEKKCISTPRKSSIISVISNLHTFYCKKHNNFDLEKGKKDTPRIIVYPVVGKENFTFQELKVIVYNFTSDTCVSTEYESFYSESLVYILDPLIVYEINAHSYKPDCVDADSKYVLNNVWVSPVKKDIVQKTVDSKFMENVEQQRIKLQFAILKIWNESDFSEMQHLYQRNNNIDGYQIVVRNETAVMELCKDVEANDIVRSKKIGNTCFSKIPVIVGNKTMFSTDGINLDYESDIVECPVVFNDAPVYTYKQLLYLAEVSTIVILFLLCVVFLLSYKIIKLNNLKCKSQSIQEIES
uniref:Phosphatidylinositol-glycan biosynthesis class X protein n=1 Tax=Rhabditophanes sp. KR3021 TaxID=114890 RepID=A0AC35TKX8_9BILA